MQKEELQNSTIIVLQSNGKFKIYDHEDDGPHYDVYGLQPTIKPTPGDILSQPIKAEAAIEAAIEAQTQRISKDYPSIFVICPETGKRMIKAKGDLIYIDEWDNKHFPGALKGWARWNITNRTLNSEDVFILKEILRN